MIFREEVCCTDEALNEGPLVFIYILSLLLSTVSNVVDYMA